MAQAARLSVRMQKELKLLLTDPPPGASFPFLSSDSNFSLSTIDAEIEGPEGTVYSQGKFHIRIQIPERYPFQPPNVTFVTPIYHPNIDNGGRICLDILNLPPKGAWQPSLNISTVMTSIGLLLSEPNPDDGLMCEMSREYKYNRCIFNQKARAMTEKYAKAGACSNSSKNQSVQTNADLSTSVDGNQPDKESEDVVYPSNSKVCGISRKLSLAPSKLTHKGATDREENVQIDFTNMEAKERERDDNAREVPKNSYLSCEKLCGSGATRNSPLDSSVHKDGNVRQVLKHSYLSCNTVPLPMGSEELPLHRDDNARQVHLREDSELAFDNKVTTSKKLSQAGEKMLHKSSDTRQTSDGNNEKLRKHSVALSGECSSVNQYQQQNFQCSLDELPDVAVDSKRKRTCSIGKKLSLGFRGLQRKVEKENILQIHSNPKSQMMTEIMQKQESLHHTNQFQGSNENSDNLLLHSVKPNETQNRDQSSVPAESVIVLDSEESEEESDGARRRKLSVVRKHIGKRKSQA